MLRRVVGLLTVLGAIVAFSPSSGATPPELERRGCCSHHGGPSGACCANGHQQCNDGGCSPTCEC